jgi:hypothetical protein
VVKAGAEGGWEKGLAGTRRVVGRRKIYRAVAFRVAAGISVITD